MTTPPDKIKLTLGDLELLLSMEQALELREKLDQVLGKEVVLQPVFVPCLILDNKPFGEISCHSQN